MPFFFFSALTGWTGSSASGAGVSGGNEAKKMLEYAKKYNSGVVKNYIPFNMRIYCDNDSTLYEIINILAEGFEYFKDMSANILAEMR